eukprot:TRINITY_DN20181_c0_g1_i1.p1 TRINITY_DN20181_c0_g1~~TRINITY_DN20181_c0_g1_i1.p1  ORF type:complete len:773 (+),score=116.63 TRINITY_DN20181_c0_g1_i1:343-2661(+)
MQRPWRGGKIHRPSLGRLVWYALLTVASTANLDDSLAISKACAFVTIVFSNDFVKCASVLTHSLRAVGTHNEVVVLVHPSIRDSDRRGFLDAGAHHVIEVQEIENPNQHVLYKSFARNYGILRVWQLNSLLGHRIKRAIYMDADMVALQNGDDLCDLPELSASRDLAGTRDRHTEDFNAGMMVLTPSEATFARLVNLAPHVASPTGGVQPLLRAGFPDWTKLDHFRDNVNVHVFEHQRPAWQLGHIRSIHYTGPVKPCLTDAEDFEKKPHDEPYRVWHTVQGYILSAVAEGQRFGEPRVSNVNFSSICLESGAATDGTAATASRGVSGSNEAVVQASIRDAWSRWWGQPSDDVLRLGFGHGEDEYRFAPAHHVCKHGAATLESFAQRVFESGLSQLRNCMIDACSPAAEVIDGIARATRWLSRTLQIFLNRASADAQVEVGDGLGSVESILSSQGNFALEEVQTSLKQLAEEAVTQPNVFVFDLAGALGRRLLQRTRLARWHLTYALLGLLWSIQRQVRDGGGDGPIQAPASFHFMFPPMEFHNDVRACCRVWNVFSQLLENAPAGAVVVLVGDLGISGDGLEDEDGLPLASSTDSSASPISQMLLEEVLLSTIPHVTLLVVEGQGSGDKRRHRLAELEAASNGRLHLGVSRKEVPADALALVAIACPPHTTITTVSSPVLDGATAEQLQQAQFEFVSTEIAYWTNHASGGGSGEGSVGERTNGGFIVAGCGLSPRHPHIVEAVGLHAIQRGARVSVAADGVWWWRVPTHRN